MSVFSNIKKSTRKLLLVGALVATVIGSGVFATHTASAASNPCPGHDNDSNAVIYCGGDSTSNIINKYNNGDGRNSAASIHNIYNCFGISSADIKALGSTAVQGTVTKSGDVYVGDELVATGAMTGGRDPMTGGSNRTNCNGTGLYKRTPNVSFRSGSLPALVSMKDGVFQFAILKACGNPVIAKAKTPDYSISKAVSIHGTGDYKASITGLKPGTKVEYRIRVRSTGDIAVRNVTVKDNLPPNVTYVNNTLTRALDGHNAAAVSGDSVFFRGGTTIDKLDNGHFIDFKFAAIVGSSDPAATCNDNLLTNTGTIDTKGLKPKSDTAKVSEKCAPKPAYSCVNLKAAPGSNANTLSFTATASASNGAEIVGYHFIFGDNTTADTTGPTTPHTYAAPGTYIARVAAKVRVPGSSTIILATDETKCVASVTIVAPPAAECVKLTATPDPSSPRTKYNFAANVKVTGGATILKYYFSFSDTSQIFESASPNYTHTYTAPGTYLAGTSALVKIGNTTKLVSSPSCRVPVTITNLQVAECTGLTLKIEEGRNVTATVTYTSGATLKGVAFDFGDGTPMQATTAATATHTYQQDGNYVVKAIVALVPAGGTVASASNCQAPVSFSTQQPTYTCDTFDLSVNKTDRSVTATNFTTTATNGAAFDHAVIDWGDSSATTSTVNVVGQTHTYAADGNYTVNVVAHFTVAGQDQDVTASGPACQKTVSFSTTPPPATPPVETPPTTLVNTGAGSVAGLFAAVAAIGAFVHRRLLSRRLNDLS